MSKETRVEPAPLVELCLALSPDPRSVGQARQFVRQALASSGCGEVEDLAVLLVSELVTNVVRHTGSDCVLSIRVAGGTVRVEVVDDSAIVPRPANPSLDDTSGRGLLLVDALAAHWGTQPGPGPAPGKTVWFELPAEAATTA